VAQELYANDSATTVTSGGTIAGTAGTIESWTVASSASFPFASNAANPPTQFHVADPAAPSEMVTVTNVAGTIGATWTVTRGAENTAPVAHAPGFTAIAVLTAGDLGGLATYTGDLALTSGTTQVISTHLGSPMPVAQGGIGASSLTTYGILAGGTATTSPVQQIAAGTVSTVLTGNGAGTLPSFQVLPAASATGSGIIQIDGTATDIQPPGTQSAGSSGLAADAKHVHPPSLNPLPPWTGYTVWTGDPMTGASTRVAASVAALYSSGFLYVTRFILPSPVTINGFLSFYWVQPTGGTPANCFAGLYDSGGTRKYTTSDLTGTASGAQRVNMSLTSLSTGTYYFASLVGTQGGTGGGFALFSNASLTYQNTTTDSKPYRMGLLTGQSTLPTTLTYASFIQGNAYPWFAID
jgi:hypothetical protein